MNFIKSEMFLTLNIFTAIYSQRTGNINNLRLAAALKPYAQNSIFSLKRTFWNVSMLTKRLRNSFWFFLRFGWVFLFFLQESNLQSLRAPVIINKIPKTREKSTHEQAFMASRVPEAHCTNKPLSYFINF